MIAKTLNCFIVIQLGFARLQTQASPSQQSFFERKFVNPSDWTPNESSVQSSKITCGSKCLASSECSAFHYNPTTNVCEIGSKLCIEFASTGKALYVTQTQGDNGDSSNIAKAYVFRKRNKDFVHYSFSVNLDDPSSNPGACLVEISPIGMDIPGQDYTYSEGTVGFRPSDGAMFMCPGLYHTNVATSHNYDRCLMKSASSRNFDTVLEGSSLDSQGNRPLYANIVSIPNNRMWVVGSEEGAGTGAISIETKIITEDNRVIQGPTLPGGQEALRSPCAVTINETTTLLVGVQLISGVWTHGQGYLYYFDWTTETIAFTHYFGFFYYIAGHMDRCGVVRWHDGRLIMTVIPNHANNKMFLFDIGAQELWTYVTMPDMPHYKWFHIYDGSIFVHNLSTLFYFDAQEFKLIYRRMDTVDATTADWKVAEIGPVPPNPGNPDFTEMFFT